MHLLGHSWGGSLAAAYVLEKGTDGIASVILSSPLLSTRMWIEDANYLRSQLPEDVQRTLTEHEHAGTSHGYSGGSCVFDTTSPVITSKTQASRSTVTSVKRFVQHSCSHVFAGHLCPHQPRQPLELVLDPRRPLIADLNHPVTSW